MNNKSCSTCKYWEVDSLNPPCDNCKQIDGFPHWAPKNTDRPAAIPETPETTTAEKGTCDTCKHDSWSCWSKSVCRNCNNFNLYEKSIVEKKSRPAATPEPMSKPGKKEVFPELIKDIEARQQVGIKTYGYPLQTHNGRDALNDALQESIDQCLYIKQAIMERDESDSFDVWEKKIRKWANDRDLYANVTPYSQLKKMIEEAVEWAEETRGGAATEAEKLEIGDMLIVLTNIAGSRGVSLWECGMMAYEKIKDRKGKIINGSFVKDGDDR